MSSKREIIEVFPPEYNTLNEEKTIGNFECPQCRGRGYHKDFTRQKESVRATCTRCEGTGRLKAFVEIIWEADHDI